jgi:putative PIN family toxin of toxin-antitoxin system
VRLLDAAIDGVFKVVLSPYLLAEVEQTLSEPEVRALRGLTDPQIAAFIGALAEVAEVVEGAYTVDLVARDPDDNPVVACALEAGARFVVTDDRKHLLPLKACRLPDGPDRAPRRVPAPPSVSALAGELSPRTMSRRELMEV